MDELTTIHATFDTQQSTLLTKLFAGLNICPAHQRPLCHDLIGFLIYIFSYVRPSSTCHRHQLWRRRSAFLELRATRTSWRHCGLSAPDTRGSSIPSLPGLVPPILHLPVRSLPKDGRINICLKSQKLCFYVFKHYVK